VLSLTILTGGQYGLALLPVSLPVALRARLDHEVSLSEAVKTAGWAPGTTRSPAATKSPFGVSTIGVDAVRLVVGPWRGPAAVELEGGERRTWR